jgi:hypothetical protein
MQKIHPQAKNVSSLSSVQFSVQFSEGISLNIGDWVTSSSHYHFNESHRNELSRAFLVSVRKS